MYLLGNFYDKCDDKYTRACLSGEEEGKYLKFNKNSQKSLDLLKKSSLLGYGKGKSI